MQDILQRKRLKETHGIRYTKGAETIGTGYSYLDFKYKENLPNGNSCATVEYSVYGDYGFSISGVF